MSNFYFKQVKHKKKNGVKSFKWFELVVNSDYILYTLTNFINNK